MTYCSNRKVDEQSNWYYIIHKEKVDLKYVQVLIGEYFNILNS